MKKYLVVIAIALLSLSFSTYSQSEENGEISEPTATKVEMSKIVFFRTGRGGGAVKCHVHNMAGEPMGYLAKSGDSCSIEIKSGTHQFWSRAASRNDVVVSVEAGNTY
jgi:hypothetical protein